MPEPPERPIEKLLRDIAKCRREDPNAAFELHPTTRRMLQAELARKFPAQAKKLQTWTRFLIPGWPKLAWGVAVIALVFGVWVLLPPATHKNPETLLASNRTQTPVASTSEGLASRVSPSLKPVQSELREQALVNANESFGGVASTPTVAGANIAATLPPQSPGDVSATMQNSSPAKRDEQRLALVTEGVASTESKTVPSDKRQILAEELKDSEAPAPPPSTTVVVAVGIDAGTEKPSDSSSTSALTVLTQHFDLLRSVPQQRSIATSDLKTKTQSGRIDALRAVAPVLASFQLEQTGRRLRVIDQDGSIYVGNLQSGLAGGMQVSSQFSAPRAEPVATGLLPATVPSTAQTYLFRVAGTNLSLNQRVVFWGKLIESTNATSIDQPLVGARLQKAGQLETPATQLPRSPIANRRLSGTAVVGDGTEIPVEAVSASPQK